VHILYADTACFGFTLRNAIARGDRPALEALKKELDTTDRMNHKYSTVRWIEYESD